MKKKLKIDKELTPRKMACPDCESCPAIFETNSGTYAVIGKVLDSSELKLSKRVGKDEILVEIPKELLDGLEK